MPLGLGISRVDCTWELMNLGYNARKLYDAFIEEQKRSKEMEEIKKKEEESKEQEKVMWEKILKQKAICWKKWENKN